MIDVQNISKVYGKKSQAFTALEDINLSIETGEAVAIVGKSGSGKSTLMHILSGLDHPSKGAVIVDGQDIAGLKQKDVDNFRAEKIGFIFQAFFVQPNETCYQNVALPLEILNISGDERKRRIEDALSHVELLDKVNEKAVNLSGGQKQRLAIARALVNKPSIVFADEPTGNLDSTTGEAIEDLLFKLNKEAGTTLIIVTHDHELAAKCDRQIRMHDGKIQNEPAKRGKKS